MNVIKWLMIMRVYLVLGFYSFTLGFLEFYNIFIYFRLRIEGCLEKFIVEFINLF